MNVTRADAPAIPGTTTAEVAARPARLTVKSGARAGVGTGRGGWFLYDDIMNNYRPA